MIAVSSRTRGAIGRTRAAVRSATHGITTITGAIRRSTGVNRNSCSVNAGISTTNSGETRRTSKSNDIANCKSSGVMPTCDISSGIGKGSGVIGNGSAR